MFVAKYFRLMKDFFIASAIADFEYRANLLVKVFTDLIWYAAQLSVFRVLMGHVPQIEGWTIESIQVFMGVLFVVDAGWMVFFSENLDRFSEKVRLGDIDLYLAKPVSAQFLLSCQKMNTAYLLNVGLALGWVYYWMSHMAQPPTTTRIFLLVLLAPASLMITYSIRFILSSFCILFGQADSLTYIWYQIYRLSNRPDSLYPQWLRYLVLTFLPVGFIASVPSRVVLGSASYAMLAATLLMAGVFLFFSTRFWRYCLRFHSSASH